MSSGSAATYERRQSTHATTLKWTFGVGKSLTLASATDVTEPVDINGYTRFMVDRILALDSGLRVAAPTDPKAFLEWLDKL